MRPRWVLIGVLVVAVLCFGGYALARPSSRPRASGCWWSYPALSETDHAASCSARRNSTAFLTEHVQIRGVLGSGSAHLRAAAPGAHGAFTPNRYGIDIQAVYDAGGDPSLVANFSPDGGLAKPRWSTCSPPDLNVCRPTSATQFLNAGATPAGTVFQATAKYKGRTYVARTAPWQGTLRAVVAPRLDGHPRYDATVTPHRASWTGGWEPHPTYKSHDGADSAGRGPDFDFLSVEACRTLEARRCVNLSAPASTGGFRTRPPVVGAWCTGWYLFAIDQRFAHDTAFAAVGYTRPAAVPPVRLGATAAHSAPLGPVIGPPAPRVSILHDARLHDGRVLVARVRCSVRCRAVLQVDDNHTSSSAHATFTGSRLLSVPRGQLRQGPLTVQIYVDTGPLVHGTTVLRGGRQSPSRRIPVCRASSLGVRLIHSFAGLGHSGGYLAFTNRANRTCKLRGWPKLIGLTAKGQAMRAREAATEGPVGATVNGVPTVTLKTHQRGDAVLSANDGPGPGRDTCPPSYHKLRVTPPDNSKAVVISAWIPYLNAYLPACTGIAVSPIVPSSALYKG